MERILMETNFPDLKLFKRGKVRDTYGFGDHLLIVATDRISTFDCIHPTGIPDKGKILTKLSAFWFDFTKWICSNHFVTTNVDRYPKELDAYAEPLQGRSMLVSKTQVIPFECVVRGYIYGSGWREYQDKGTVCGIQLPHNLKEADKLSEPIFTPATKAQIGLHDENISFDRMAEIIGRDLAETLRKVSLLLYEKAAEYALEKGIIIADTKFEFGWLDGNALLLIDELFTPDSSRFWPADQYQPGGKQPSFDKQFVREYVSSIGWNKEPPAPEIPEDIVEKTREKYLEALKLLTGQGL